MKELKFMLNKSAFSSVGINLLGKSYLFRNTLDFIEGLRRAGIVDSSLLFTSDMFPYTSLPNKESIRNHIKNRLEKVKFEDHIYIELRSSENTNTTFTIPLYMLSIETRKIVGKVTVIPQGKLFI
jgi:hypothetical protein